MDLLLHTAELRFGSEWESIRSLLTTRGLDPQQIVLLSYESAGGSDMDVWMALPDGSIVECVMREDAVTKRYAAITEWRVVTGDSGAEVALAARVASDPVTAEAFASAVQSFQRFCRLIGPHSLIT